MIPEKLNKKIKDRNVNNAFRQLGKSSTLVDFSSNDYLGFSNSKSIFERAHQFVSDTTEVKNGATGSRLLSGNHSLYPKVESQICSYHYSESALIFNSGYTANMGVLSCVPQRNDVILYDELAHASIRDGITMSLAKAYKFKHNNLTHLETVLERIKTTHDQIYIVTESVFSMDGDSPDIKRLIRLCDFYNANLIIDEAHAIGVFGKGLVSAPVFAKIITFSKALGCHGAAVLGSKELKTYLVNFSRPFIYTTALPPHALATIAVAYHTLIDQSSRSISQNQNLKKNIAFFNSEIIRLQLQDLFITSHSAIHCCIIPGNIHVKRIAKSIQDSGFSVKPILSPTVSIGKERLRFCIHSYNSKKEISEVLLLLTTFVAK